jgi:phage terminase large subunit-like protein
MATTEPESGAPVELRPFREQEPFLNDDRRFYGYVSGVGAGKTFAGILRTVLNMERWNPGEMGAIVAPTTTMVKDVILSEMRDFGLLEHWDYKSSYSDEPGLHAPNGSRALILSADNQRTIERLRGLNLAWWWMDEEAIIDKRARDILTQRLRTGEYRNGYITTTPKGRNHTYDFFIGDVNPEEMQHGESTLYFTADRLAIVGVPTQANPHTPADYKRSVERDLPEALIAQEVRGQFVELGGSILTRDALSFVHVDDMGPEDREYSWHVAADLALESSSRKAREEDTDYWAAAVIAHDPMRGQAFLIDIARTRGMTKDQGIEWLASIMDGLPTNTVGVESVGAQRWFAEDAKNAGLSVYEVNQTRKKEDRLTYLSVPFANESIRVVNHDDPDDRPPGQDYDPRWNAFVEEWLAFPDGTHDDTLDAVEMALRNVSLGGIGNFEGGDAYE